MDRILAFSIMSSSPADIAGTGYATTRLSWRRQQQPEKKQEEQIVEQSPRPERKPEARPARFAPEFDGLHCFESIVST